MESIFIFFTQFSSIYQSKEKWYDKGKCLKRIELKTIAEEIRMQLAEFTLFDDDFMREFFQDNIECVELVVQVILENPKLKVKSVDIQHDIKNYGHRDVTFDIVAVDEDNKIYDIEIQRSNHGAIPKRARFHSSILDVKSLDAKDDFSKLPETYIIFITENDVLKNGLAIYHIERKILETNELFDDNAHIIYVNGSFKGETPIGNLIHDFSCKNSKDMKYEKLAEKMKYYKEDEEGGRKMCDKLQAIWDKHEKVLIERLQVESEKREKQVLTETRNTIAIRLLKTSKMQETEIALMTDLSLSEVEILAKEYRK